MISSGRLSDRKQYRIKTYCFWIGDGELFVDKKEALSRYDKDNLICNACQGCQICGEK